MCWSCNMDAANAMLVDSERVLGEAHTMRKHGLQIQAQALSDKHLATQLMEEDLSTCEEVEDEDPI